MNSRDKENLQFLMNIDEDTFNDWLSKADNDDLEYALQLIRMAKLDLIVKKIEIMDNVSDTTDAKSIIEKIKNKR